LRLDYGTALESVLARLEKRLSEDVALAAHYPLRWLALKLMENDSEAQRLVGKHAENKEDKYAKTVYAAYKGVDKTLKRLDTARRKERVHVSFAGRFGHFLEPVSQWAGFDWKVNIALASSFAAKENLVATLGTIYSVGEESGDTLTATMAKDTAQSWTPVHALALMLFVALFPPCIATLIMVRVETGSTKWMLFAATYPIILGFMIAVIVFQGGTAPGPHCTAGYDLFLAARFYDFGCYLLRRGKVCP